MIINGDVSLSTHQAEDSRKARTYMKLLKVEMPVWAWLAVPVIIVVVSRRPNYVTAIPTALSAIATSLIHFIDHLHLHLTQGH